MRIEWLKFDDYVPARITKKSLGLVPFLRLDDVQFEANQRLHDLMGGDDEQKGTNTKKGTTKGSSGGGGGGSAKAKSLAKS